MNSYLLVAADFIKTGGMDRANFALANYLAKQGYQIHLVAYRVATQLLDYSNITFHQVPKLLNSDFLSGSLLDRYGRFWAKRLEKNGTRVTVNGGNCQW